MVQLCQKPMPFFSVPQGDAEFRLATTTTRAWHWRASYGFKVSRDAGLCYCWRNQRKFGKGSQLFRAEFSGRLLAHHARMCSCFASSKRDFYHLLVIWRVFCFRKHEERCDVSETFCNWEKGYANFCILAESPLLDKIFCEPQLTKMFFLTCAVACDDYQAHVTSIIVSRERVRLQEVDTHTIHISINK